MKKRIINIVLTGGPCGGKTKCSKIIQNYFSQKGFVVLCVPETATELILSGVNPTLMNYYDFQRLLIQKQIAKEKYYREIAKKIKGNVIIVYDRGIIDGKAYVKEKEFHDLLKQFNLSIKKVLSNYDIVYHLTSSSIDTDKYSLKNNKARKESKDEAILLDLKTLNSWKDFDNFKVIKNNGDFNLKIKILLKDIENYCFK